MTGGKPREDAASPPWITWEDHRRSRELAAAFACDYIPLASNRGYALRTLELGWRTVRVLMKRKPRLLFIQNPSLMLAALACAMKPLLRYALIVDRHSNFELRTLTPPAPVRFVFDRLSRWTTRCADLTIVTNETLRVLADSWGGRGIILQDKLPTLGAAPAPLARPGSHLVFVCTFSEDEPVAEVIEAARRLPDGITVHVTGNDRKLPARLRESAPDNVVFTGFIPDADYQALLAACDGVIGLTTRPVTLLCCAYEAVSLGKPMVLSRHDDLMDYFRRGTVPTDNSAADLARAMVDLVQRRDELEAEVAVLAEELRADWDARFEICRRRVADLRSA